MGCESLSVALAIVLLLEPCLSLACLQCDSNFSSHFSSYAPKLSRKSWGLGVVPVAGRRLRGWAQDTLQELNLKISPDIPVEKLHTIATTVYGKLDMLFKNHTYKPGDLPKKLDSIFEEQIKMLQDAIVESRIKCENHCGLNHYEAISCQTCNATKPTCFGYNCSSSDKWKDALNELYDYVKGLNKEPEVWASALRQVPTFSHCTAESPDTLNFTSIGDTLSKNWLKMMALKDMEEDAALLKLLEPTC
ncbi:izumo sperm-egg fusion protein 4 isoform X1 [Pantherophis guttatus]|uniref:Izumo sperm-egg fusion protein 4 isoform X1 n=1 Tax=Pantherophis guttatus TaxID=94885 RepID=A0A6P9DR50_PANGU|nr:izumo sperm-egg fusion protein 4 isoform X1 [Pantherophis guttatus]